MIAVLGAGGQLGSALVRILGDHARPVTRTELDVTDREGVESWLRESSPEAVINCTAYTAVDAAEDDREAARRVNADAVALLASITAETGARFVTFSTDYVFDGTKGSPYVESDSTNPLNVYGATKLEGERRSLDLNPDALVVRTSWVMSGTHPNFIRTILRLLDAGPVQVVDDQVGRPTLVDDLAPAVLNAMSSGSTGLLHLTNAGQSSWFGLAREIAEIGGFDPARVEPISSSESNRPAIRPADSRLDSERIDPGSPLQLPDYHGSLERAIRMILSDESSV